MIGVDCKLESLEVGETRKCGPKDRNTVFALTTAYINTQRTEMTKFSKDREVGNLETAKAQ